MKAFVECLAMEMMESLLCDGWQRSTWVVSLIQGGSPTATITGECKIGLIKLLVLDGRGPALNSL